MTAQSHGQRRIPRCLCASIGVFVSEGASVHVEFAPPQREQLAGTERPGRTRLEGGEVLLAVVGATIGKIGIVPDSWHGANIARAVCRIVPGPKLHRDFLVYVLESQEVQNYFRVVTRTLAQPTLNVGQVQQTRIPLPSLPEQRRIVAILDELQGKVDAAKELQSETSTELDAIMPSILDKAFRGEL